LNANSHLPAPGKSASGLGIIMAPAALDAIRAIVARTPGT